MPVVRAAIEKRPGLLDGVAGLLDSNSTDPPAADATGDDLGGIIPSLLSPISPGPTSSSSSTSATLSSTTSSSSISSSSTSSISSTSTTSSSSSTSSASSSSSSASALSSSSKSPSSSSTLISTTPILPSPSLITSTITYTSGTVVVTQTSLVPAPSNTTIPQSDAAAAPKSFLQNKPLEGGVFAAVGIVFLILLVILATCSLRRSRRRSLERDIAEASILPPTRFDDDDNNAPAHRTSGIGSDTEKGIWTNTETSSSEHGSGMASYRPAVYPQPPLPQQPLNDNPYATYTQPYAFAGAQSAISTYPNPIYGLSQPNAPRSLVPGALQPGQGPSFTQGYAAAGSASVPFGATAGGGMNQNKPLPAQFGLNMNANGLQRSGTIGRGDEGDYIRSRQLTIANE